jgi:hypothetical protein
VREMCTLRGAGNTFTTLEFWHNFLYLIIYKIKQEQFKKKHTIILIKQQVLLVCPTLIIKKYSHFSWRQCAPPSEKSCWRWCIHSMVTHLHNSLMWNIFQIFWKLQNHKLNTRIKFIRCIEIKILCILLFVSVYRNTPNVHLWLMS